VSVFAEYCIFADGFGDVATVTIAEATQGVKQCRGLVYAIHNAAAHEQF
jgi:hypothetical protein